jgi:tetratricopeptide (TPR) repeat protein
MLRGASAAAEADFDKALAAAEQLVRERPLDRAFRFSLAEMLSNRGYLLIGLAEAGPARPPSPELLRRAEADHRRALELRHELAREEPENPDYKAYLAASLNLLANALQLQGKDHFAEAEADYRTALELLEPLAAAFTGVPSHRQDMAMVFNNLSLLYQEQRRGDEAVRVARRGVEVFTRIQRMYPRVALHATELGVVRERLGETESAAGHSEAAGRSWYDAALAFAAAASAQQDAAQREPLAAKAVTLLGRAREAKYFNDPVRAREFRAEAGFDGIRSRPDFQEVQQAIGAK